MQKKIKEHIIKNPNKLLMELHKYNSTTDFNINVKLALRSVFEFVSQNQNNYWSNKNKLLHNSPTFKDIMNNNTLISLNIIMSIKTPDVMKYLMKFKKSGITAKGIKNT